MIYQSNKTILNTLIGAFSGMLAVIPNEAILNVADAAGVPTAHGGLLVLVKLVAGHAFNTVAAGDIWRLDIAPHTSGPLFQVFFHASVAIIMGAAYGALLVPLLKVSWWMRGAGYGGAVWLMNALIVLPVTGEGYVGLGSITAVGALLFALAHFTFFLTLAWSFSRLANARIFGAGRLPNKMA